jgi:hypothetical protein
MRHKEKPPSPLVSLTVTPPTGAPWTATSANEASARALAGERVGGRVGWRVEIEAVEQGGA